MEGDTDPQALEMARWIHHRYRPLATVLFGSRARGDHRKDSDIDVLVITEEEMDDEELWQSGAEVQEAAKELGTAVPVQLVPVNLLTATEDERYADSLITQALREGTLLADDPAAWRSQYDGEDPPPPMYQWSHYKWLSEVSKSSVEMMHAYVGKPDGRVRVDPMVGIARRLHKMKAGEEERRNWLGTKADQSMRLAMRTLIAATGRVTRNSITLEEAVSGLEVVPGTAGLRLGLDPKDSDQGMPSDMTEERFEELVHNDVTAIRQLAQKTRRLTERESRRALREWETSRV